MKASVIVLGYNGVSYVEACLRSLEDQDLPRDAYEILFIDNGSTDGTPDAVQESFPGVRLLRLSENVGFSAGNNRGAEAARGEVLAFLNQDMVVHRRWLRGLLAALDSSPEVGVAHSNMVMPWGKGFSERDLTGVPSVIQYYDLSCFGFAQYMLRPYSVGVFETLFLSGGAFAMRRQTVEELGGVFDEALFAYAYAEDTDLALRVLAAGKRIVVAPDSVVYHLQHELPSASPRALIHGVKVTRNRYFAFYKNSTAFELAVLLPLLCVGGPLKAFVLEGGRRALCLLFALVPITVLGFLLFLIALPSLRHSRRSQLKRRTCGRLGLVRLIVGRRQGTAAIQSVQQ